MGGLKLVDSRSAAETLFQKVLDYITSPDGSR